jgi:hypothetical protein
VGGLTVGNPRLSPTLPYAETTSNTARGLSRVATTLGWGMLTDGEDIEPTSILRIGQARTLMIPLVSRVEENAQLERSLL